MNQEPALSLARPLMNAAGSLGFSPEKHGPLALDSLGAFVTNPISRRARKPVKGQRLARFPGGALLHSGHPNPGLSRVLQRYGPRWARAPVPIIVHLLAGEAEEVRGLVERLEEVDSVTGVELGLPAEVSREHTAELISAALGELPLIVRMPLNRALDLAEAAMQQGAAIVSLGPPRGAVQRASGEMLRGRIYGPGLFPEALYIVENLAERGLPVIGAGGIYTPEQAQAMLAVGARAVQLDTVLWRGRWEEEP